MKFSRTRPTAGQYVAVWNFRGAVWSETIRVDADGIIRIYNDITNDFDSDFYGKSDECTDLRFYRA